MTPPRLLLAFAVLTTGAILNLVVSPQVYSPRLPVFNGVDIASSWEWRSMALHEHPLWLSYHFPGALVINAGQLVPPSLPTGRDVGIAFSNSRDKYLDIVIDLSEPPLEASNLGIRDELLSYAKVFSRINCRDFQAMAMHDGCFYFVAWNDEMLPESNPTFVGVRTNLTGLEEDSEYALVEQRLLESIVDVPLEELPNVWEVDPGD